MRALALPCLAAAAGPLRWPRVDSYGLNHIIGNAGLLRDLEISRLESGSMERGPSLLTLVRLAHAAGKRLVIGIEDEEGENKASTRVLTI
jgi:hypothetical protein